LVEPASDPTATEIKAATGDRCAVVDTYAVGMIAMTITTAKAVANASATTAAIENISGTVLTYRKVK